ncbi:MAG TPA: SRPBCC domain-containing protein [Longimicrobiaceae bacterium]|nr:SRPBCC domain-containing protein [Longimicrobiaceae bacterium]
MRMRVLHELIDIDASPEAVYDALVSSAVHERLTGLRAEILSRPGGMFVTCAGRCHGWNLVLVRGQRIVQAWADSSWPPDHYSLLRFEFVRSLRGTRLQVTQIGVPAFDFDRLASFWRSRYWESLRGMFGGR